jgi:hypothetical protein
VPFYELNFANNGFNASGNKTFLQDGVLHDSDDRISEINTRPLWAGEILSRRECQRLADCENYLLKGLFGTKKGKAKGERQGEYLCMHNHAPRHKDVWRSGGIAYLMSSKKR